MRTGLAYILLPIVALGLFMMILSPLILVGQFIWDWFVHDSVIAVSNIEAGARLAMRPIAAFSVGGMVGAFHAAFFCGIRLFRGRWPHQN